MVGTGGIGQAHLTALAKIPEAEIVAVCDVNEARAADVAKTHSAAAYTDASRLISQEQLDALYICVPPSSHGDLEVSAAQKGIHLFVEKPVNLTLEGATVARDAIRTSGVMTQTGYVLRYLPAYMQLHALLVNIEVGAAHVTRWNGLLDVPWWRRYDQSGGQLVEMTTHQIDFLRWCMGEVEAVSASYSFDRLHRDEAGVTIPDSQSALLHFVSGASATISTSSAAGRASLGSLAFVIKDGIVTLREGAVVVEPEGLCKIPPLQKDAPGIDECFTRAVATGDRSLLKSPYDDALRTLAVTLSANRSAEEGGRLVRLSEFALDQVE